MNTRRLIYSIIIFVTLLSCKESTIDTIIPSISETDKTVSVTLTNIPQGFGGAPIFIFTLNSEGEVHAVEKAVAIENVVVKIEPPSGVAPYAIVTFIPDDSNWTTDKLFTSGLYSSTAQLSRKGAFITVSWVEAASLTALSFTGLRSSIEAALSLNGSATPTNTNFQQGSILTLDATVTDNVKANIAKVAYNLDKAEVKSYNASPYKFQLNTASVALGAHTLYVKAVNGKGDVALDSIKIFLSKAGNVGPSISFNGLVNGATFTRQELLTINTVVSDPDDGIEKIEFKINNTLVLTDRAAPYSYVWDTFNNTVGSVVLEIIAYDKAGQSRSDVVNVNLIAPANYIPRVNFTSPANGISVTAGTTVSLGATTTDTEGDPVNRVQFSYQRITPTLGTKTSIGQDTTSPYGIEFNTTGLTPGEYFIFAEAFDNSGRFTYSNITVTIN